MLKTYRNNIIASALLLLLLLMIGVLNSRSLPVVRAAPVWSNAVVLVNSASPSYPEFGQRLQTYLDHFGVPYDVLDITTAAVDSSIANYQLIIVGHTGLDAGATRYLDSTEQQAIADAVLNGSGFFSVDGDLATDADQGRYTFIDTFFGLTYQGKFNTASSISIPSSEHYITALQEAPATWALRAAIQGDVVTPPGSVASLASVGNSPLLLVTTTGQGRAVQWLSDDWIAAGTFGQFQGMDDLIWRSLVWAARKPFVLRGMPPFVTMRVDDSSGPGAGSTPWAWVDIANQYGFKPFIAFFMDDIDVEEAAKLRSLIEKGLATASIHGRSQWDFFYFDHNFGRNYPDATIQSYFADADDFYAAYGIVGGKTIVPHYYESGDNVYEELAARGIEFLTTTNRPGWAYVDSTPPMPAGPYRKYGTPGSNANQTFNVFIADWLTIAPDHPLNGQFFNVLTEVREDNYDLAPDRPSDVVIHDGTMQLKRALDSLVPASLFFHEYQLHSVSSAKWTNDLSAITANIASYEPLYVTYDHMAQYVRALATSRLNSTTFDAASSQLSITFTGNSDIDTQFYVFIDSGDTIARTPLNVTAFSGGRTVTVDLGADLETPSSSITDPAPGDTLSGSSYTIHGTASDSGSGIARVEVSTDGGETWQLASGTTSWTYSWTLPTSGLHQILSRAVDNQGNSELPSAGVTVTIEDTAPPVISQEAATNLFANGTTITWRTNEGADSQVEYGLTTAYGSTTTLNTAPVVNHSVVLNGLEPNTTYHYRVKSRDLAGNLSVGQDQTFTTPDLPPPGEAVINFDDRADPDRALSGQYPSGVVDWGNNQWYLSGPWGSFSTNSVSFLNPNDTDATFTFLVPRRLISVDAYNGGSSATTVTLSCAANPTKQVTLAAGQFGTIATDWGPTCQTVTISSSNGWDTNFDNFAHDGGGDDLWPPILSNIQVAEVGYRTVTITWTTDEPATSQVEYGTTTAYGATTPFNSTLTTNHSVDLTGLNFGTTYHFRVRSKDASDNEAVSTDHTFTTRSPIVTDFQTTASDFATGTLNQAGISEDSDGEVRLAPTLNDLFNGAALDATRWSMTSWTGGSVTLSGGTAVAQGAAIGSKGSFSGGATLETRVMFAPDAWQQVGLASDLDGSQGGNRALFSTAWGGILYARTSVNGADTFTPLPGSLIGTPHTYRIERTGTAVHYYVDGELVATHAVSVPGALAAWISDYSSGGQSVNAYWLRVTPYTATSGVYLSAVIDTEDSTEALRIAWSAQTPGGTSIEVRTRTSVDALTWSDWSAPAANGDPIASPPARYLQYQITLVTSNAATSPVVEQVGLGGLLPPLISNVTATDVTATSATIVWSTDRITSGTVEYGTTTSYGSSAADANGFQTEHSVTLTGLTPSTRYHYRVISADTGDSTAQSEDFTFITAPLTVAPLQTTAADFLAGTLNGVTISEDDGGELRLITGLNDIFLGSTLDTSIWASVNWTGGAVSLSDGVANVSGSAIYSTQTFSGEAIFEAKVTFGADSWQFLGLASDLDGSAGGNRAGFTTAWTGDTIFVRVSIGGNDTFTQVSGSYVGSPHIYRVEVGSEEVNFFIDGVLVASHALAVPGPLSAWVSDYGSWGGALATDWIRVTPYTTQTGTYISGVVDAGSGSAFTSITWTAQMPDGTTVEVRTRTSADAIEWSDWSDPVTAEGNITSPQARYLQYQITLASSDPTLSPLIESVEVVK